MWSYFRPLIQTLHWLSPNSTWICNFWWLYFARRYSTKRIWFKEISGNSDPENCIHTPCVYSHLSYFENIITLLCALCTWKCNCVFKVHKRHEWTQVRKTPFHETTSLPYWENILNSTLNNKYIHKYAIYDESLSVSLLFSNRPSELLSNLDVLDEIATFPNC